jgi:uncharacterized membrane protein YebE (DUF533 family)
MNLIGTLAKVAVGVMVARGVGSLMKNRGNAQQKAGENSGGGLGGLLGGLAGGSSSQQSPGSLGGLLGGLTGGGKQQSTGGGLGDLLGGLTGGGATQQRGATGDFGGLGGLLGGLAGAPDQSQDSRGLGGMLGNAMAGSGKQQSSGQPDGLGGLLDSLGDSGQQASDYDDRGSLGGMFNDALAGRATREPEPDQNAQAEILLRAMINAAKSDGQIDQAEQAEIVDHLDDVTPDEVEFVRNEMAQPLDVDAFVRSVPPELKQQVYLMSLLGIKLDSQAEAEYLDRLARGLGIDSQQANHIHTEVGVPTLYA